MGFVLLFCRIGYCFGHTGPPPHHHPTETPQIFTHFSQMSCTCTITMLHHTRTGYVVTKEVWRKVVYLKKLGCVLGGETVFLETVFLEGTPRCVPGTIGARSGFPRVFFRDPNTELIAAGFGAVCWFAGAGVDPPQKSEIQQEVLDLSLVSALPPEFRVFGGRRFDHAARGVPVEQEVFVPKTGAGAPRTDEWQAFGRGDYWFLPTIEFTCCSRELGGKGGESPAGARFRTPVRKVAVQLVWRIVDEDPAGRNDDLEQFLWNQSRAITLAKLDALIAGGVSTSLVATPAAVLSSPATSNTRPVSKPFEKKSPTNCDTQSPISSPTFTTPSPTGAPGTAASPDLSRLLPNSEHVLVPAASYPTSESWQRGGQEEQMSEFPFPPPTRAEISIYDIMDGYKASLAATVGGGGCIEALDAAGASTDSDALMSPPTTPPPTPSSDSSTQQVYEPRNPTSLPQFPRNVDVLNFSAQNDSPSLSDANTPATPPPTPRSDTSTDSEAHSTAHSTAHSAAHYQRME